MKKKVCNDVSELKKINKMCPIFIFLLLQRICFKEKDMMGSVYTLN